MSVMAWSVLAAAAAFVLQVEPNHSSVGFSVPIVSGMTRVTGKFTRFEMSMNYEPDDPSQWSIDASIDAGSIDTGIDERDEDLRGPAFFDVENHPRIRFESRRIESRGDELVAHGTLTMRGVRREIELPFRITGVDWSDGAPIVGAAAKLSLNRSEFGVGVDWRHSLIPNFIGEEVDVEIFLWTKPGTPVALEKGKDP